ncbi:MAG TPA: DUF4173 domain-containing protein, partial [Gemmatimonadaceae bacterium]|nr:DUF4173 domain-containing protein [Gemmatimonadaceae bacterium]
MYDHSSDLSAGAAGATSNDMSGLSTAPASTVPSPRALLARRALLGAVLLGLVADPLLRHGPWGIGLLIWMLQFAAVVVALVRQTGRTFERESILWLTVAVLCAAGLAWHDADTLMVFDVMAMLIALVLLAMSLANIPVAGLSRARVRDLVRAAFGTGLEVATGAIPLVLRDAELHTALRSASEGPTRRIARALVITLPVLLVFTLLLTQADPIFGSFFILPPIDIEVVLSHVVIAGFFAWVVTGWLRRSLLAHRGGRTPVTTPFPLALGATDVAFALGALNVLFAAFVIVQIGWLFGGEALVLRTTGLGYADYARRGFFELMCVAGLLLPVLLASRALVPESEARTLRLHSRLALPLVVLLGAMMVSAGARMRLYVQYYGLSVDRLYATAIMIWLAIVFVWLVATVLRARPRLFAAGMVASGYAVLLALHLLNPDALVARTNLARAGTARPGTAGADPLYLASLGGDAVPVLVSALLSAPPAADAAAAAARCSAAATVLDRWTGERGAQKTGSWTQWNLARNRAVTAVRANEGALRGIACAKVAGGAVERSAT